MAALDYYLFPCLSDNYGVLVRDTVTGSVALIDAPDEVAIVDAIERTGWTPTHILTTHHHADHTQANLALKDRFGLTIIGPRGEAGKVPGIDHEVGEEDQFVFGSAEVKVIETPGHTLGHIAYWIPSAHVVFAGDTLFSLGCGRVFEGTAEMMWTSLKKLAALPPETVVYSGHEYTAANAKFALTIEPDNASLKAYADEVVAKRAKNEPTVPTTIGAELAANPFLRADRAETKAAIGMGQAADAEVFAEIRKRKDNF